MQRVAAPRIRIMRYALDVLICCNVPKCVIHTAWCFPAAVGGGLEFEHQPHKTLICKILVIHHIVICFFFFQYCKCSHTFFSFQFSTDNPSIFYTSMHTFLLNFIYLHFWIVLARKPWEWGVKLKLSSCSHCEKYFGKKKEHKTHYQ